MRLRQSMMGWACATVAPWALGVGLLVSFTASAGQDADAGFSAAILTAHATPIAPVSLVPTLPGLASGALLWQKASFDAGFYLKADPDGIGPGAGVCLARLPVEDPVALDPDSIGRPPRGD